ncbi:MAG: DNA polymerase III subunit gamma/tau [bacterium]|nr:DNA polymerase III subunit gamma/tau [bacterium]
MFYLKYRPKTISEIDNSHVKDILKKLLESNDIPHALLLIGQKGTGKTSTARIIAKSLNCLQNKFATKSDSIEPCNICENCQSISNSSFTDVLEMDAASNRGIEEIKNLIRETSFLPMSGRYRVFIIDEAHMITPDGFNALLKTLEEPPSTAVFILATTNPEKIPKTIASRCVRINFGKAKKEDMINMLNRIVKSENLTFEKGVLEIISTHGESSFRDATKILEELTIQKITTLAATEQFLGMRGKNNLLEIIESQDEKTVYNWIHEFEKGSGNFKNLIEDMLNQLRILLLSKKGIEIEDHFKSNLTLSQITKLIKLLMEAYQNLRLSPIESLPLEIALSEFYNKTNTN